MTLTLKIESHFFHMTFQLTVVHHNTKFGYKRLHINTHQGLLPTVWHRPGEQSDVRYPWASPLLRCWSPHLPPSPPATEGCAGGLGQPLNTQQSQNQLHTGAGDREKLKADRHWRHSRVRINFTLGLETGRNSKQTDTEDTAESESTLHWGWRQGKLKADRHWRHSRVRISNFMLELETGENSKQT